MNKEYYRKIATSAANGGLRGARDALGKTLTDNQLMKVVGRALENTVQEYYELEKNSCVYTADGRKINIGDTVYWVRGKSTIIKCEVIGYTARYEITDYDGSICSEKLISIKYYDSSETKFKTTRTIGQRLFSEEMLASQLKNSMV